MNGQWMGRFSGTNTGDVILELDRIGAFFEGRVYAYDDRADLPGTAAYVKIPINSTSFNSNDLRLIPLDPATGDFSNWHSLSQRFPNITFPSTADAEWAIGPETISLKWSTDIVTSGEALLTKIHGEKPSELKPIDVHTWDDFRVFVRELEHYRYIFRGQESNRWRLRTGFHRTERSDLVRFLQTDIPTLHQHLSSLTAHSFNLRDPIDNAAFISLSQHHGYPTPLLDWTYSPFIGAYFGFKPISVRRGWYSPGKKDKVRIFVFDQERWRNDWRQLSLIQPARPHFSIVHALAINNARMIPQQALATVTNVEDIESYIASKENDGHQYLQVIDLPGEIRSEVLKDLSVMGINAGSLFPGLDGACSQLKDRFFGF